MGSSLPVRYFEPTALPEGVMTFDLVPYLDPRKDRAAWLALMDAPDGLTRSLASVVTQFLRHRDRKFLFQPDGTAIRRRVLVREQNIRLIGKEAHRLEASIVLGVDASGGRTTIYDDVVARILALPLSWARKHGIDRGNFARLRRKGAPRPRSPAPDPHQSAAVLGGLGLNGSTHGPFPRHGLGVLMRSSAATPKSGKGPPSRAGVPAVANQRLMVTKRA